MPYWRPPNVTYAPDGRIDGIFTMPNRSIYVIIRPMFGSLRARIVFYLSVVIVITAAVLMIFTHRDVGQNILSMARESAENTFQFVELSITGQYNNLLFDRIETITKRRAQLKNLSAVCLSFLEEYARLATSGHLESEEATQAALSWFKSVEYEKAIQLFVLDADNQIISHPDSELEGTSVNEFQDMKKRPLAHLLDEKNISTSGEFAVFNWTQQGKKLGFFTPFPKWKWIIGAVIGIDDIEADAQRNLQKILEGLAETFRNFQIAHSGHVFLFNGKKEVLIQPFGKENLDYTTQINTRSGNLLLDDLMAAARSAGGSVSYGRQGSGQRPVDMVAHNFFFKPLDWYITVTYPVHEIQLPAKTIVTRQIFIMAAIFFLSLLVIYILVARISRPLNSLASYAKKLPSHDFTRDTDVASPIDDLPKRYRDEVGRLAASFVFMQDELKKNIQNLVMVTAAKERIQSELNVAREIQLGIIPKTFPSFPDRLEFNLFATLVPAKEVGGDLYDFFFIDHEHLCLAVGDVSGKGIPAALFMAITRTLVKSTAQKGSSPADIMMQANNTLSHDNPNAMFVTLFIGILNVTTGEFQYANGGHNPPIVISKSRGVIFKEDLSGPVVGALKGIDYENFSLNFSSGDGILLYTDGVNEAMNADGDLYSDERLLAKVTSLKEATVEGVIDGVMGEIKTHAGSTPQSDDIAMLMIRYLGPDR